MMKNTKLWLVLLYKGFLNFFEENFSFPEFFYHEETELFKILLKKFQNFQWKPRGNSNVYKNFHVHNAESKKIFKESRESNSELSWEKSTP